VRAFQAQSQGGKSDPARRNEHASLDAFFVLRTAFFSQARKNQKEDVVPIP
jgi:hypothetical protein